MAKHSKEYYFEQIRKNLNDDKRFAEQLQWIKDMVKHYSEVLEIPEDDIIEKFEERRSYWSANYYQESNQPRIDDKVTVFNSVEEFYKAFPSKKFRCSICGGITTDPQTCNSGVVRKDGKVCDWKTWGLFKLHNSFRCIIKDKFLDNPVVFDLFTPIELEEKTIDEILSDIRKQVNNEI